jgi:hypothetical protein
MTKDTHNQLAHLLEQHETLLRMRNKMSDPFVRAGLDAQLLALETAIDALTEAE